MHGFFVLILIEKRNKDIDYYVFVWECSVYLFESVSLYLVWKMILYIINTNIIFTLLNGILKEKHNLYKTI